MVPFPEWQIPLSVSCPWKFIHWLQSLLASLKEDKAPIIPPVIHFPVDESPIVFSRGTEEEITYERLRKWLLKNALQIGTRLEGKASKSKRISLSNYLIEDSIYRKVIEALFAKLTEVDALYPSNNRLAYT